MKNLNYLILGFFIALSFSKTTYGQLGGDIPTIPMCDTGTEPCDSNSQFPCDGAIPFCSDQTYNFPNTSGNSMGQNGAPCGPRFCCLGSTPNPIWYYMEVAETGVIEIQIEQYSSSGFGLDVDFAMWGPFTSMEDGCNQIMAGQQAIQCSYSADDTETIGLGTPGGDIIDMIFIQMPGSGASNPPIAQAGEVYIVLLTNFSGQEGNISFYQSNYGASGAGSTDCSIVIPCSISNLTATPTACEDDLYSVSGSFSVSDAPETGDLIAEDCNGNQVVIASAPFTASTYNYNFDNLVANGATCEIHVYFSDETACSKTTSFTAPEPCTIVDECFITSFEINISPCDGDEFEITGVIEFTDPPSSGQLIVVDCDGHQQTFNAPFTSPQNFTISNLPANGEDCNVTAYFTADSDCTIEMDYVNQDCSCSAYIGTFTATGVSSTEPTTLCFGDDFSILPNGDFNPPEDLGDGTVPYNPGIDWFIFSCPPQLPFVFDASGTYDDPCFLGYIPESDLQDINDMSFVGSFPPGTLTENTLYFLPVTMYDIDGTVSYTNTGEDCYQYGNLYEVQYLPEIIQTTTDDCHTGTVSTTVSGGLPAVNNSNFTGTNLQPSTAFFQTESTGNNGTIIVAGLDGGENFSFDIVDGNGCSISVSGIMSGSSAATISYPKEDYCRSEATNPIPTINGSTGGTFTASNSDLSIDSSTGVINLANSQAGTYTVTYSTQGVECNSESSVTISIYEMPEPSFTGNPLTGCAPLTVQFTNTSGTTNDITCSWNFGNGATSNHCNPSYTYSESGIYDVTLTLTNNIGCVSTISFSNYVDVIPSPTADFSANPEIVSTFEPIIDFTNTSHNATGYIWTFGDDSPSETTVNTSHDYGGAGEGQYVVTLIAHNGAEECNDTISKAIVVNEELIFYVPNAFTPDKDDYNEIFKPIFSAGYEPQSYELLIYNRWGELLFESNNIDYGWDGTYGTLNNGIVKEGVYIWKISIKETGKDKRNQYTGHVTLLK